MRLRDSDRAIIAEQNADAREAERGRDVCTLCGDDLTGAADEFETIEGERHRAHPDCSAAWAAIVGDRNLLDVPEVRHYQREAIEGGTVVRYEQREPGARDWQQVRLFRPDAAPAGWVVCERCGQLAPGQALRGGACQPCRLAGIARESGVKLLRDNSTGQMWAPSRAAGRGVTSRSSVPPATAPAPAGSQPERSRGASVWQPYISSCIFVL